MRHPISLALFLMLAGPLVAQDKAAAPSPDEKAFEDFVAKGDQHLTKIAPFVVQIESVWKSAGAEKGKDGKNRFRLAVGKDRHMFRIEAMKDGDKDAPLVVVSDGKSVSHFYAPKKLYTMRANDNPIEELQHEALTANALEGSGIEFLLRKDLRDHVLAHVVKVQDLGVVQLNGKQTHRFQIDLANKKQVDLWFGFGDTPLLQQMVTSMVIPVQGKEKFEFAIVTKFQWVAAPAQVAGEFRLTLPEGAKRVTSIFDALVGGDASELVGKQAPALKLTTLDGTDVKLADHVGKGPVVIYLWATWSAPSTQNRDAIVKFLDEYKQKGTTFISVNVGESPEVVKAHLEKSGFKRTVFLDLKSSSLDAYRLAALPTAIVLGADGVVRSIVSGSGPAYREQLGRDLDELLKAPPAK